MDVINKNKQNYSKVYEKMKSEKIKTNVSKVRKQFEKLETGSISQNEFKNYLQTEIEGCDVSKVNKVLNSASIDKLKFNNILKSLDILKSNKEDSKVYSKMVNSLAGGTSSINPQGVKNRKRLIKVDSSEPKKYEKNPLAEQTKQFVTGKISKDEYIGILKENKINPDSMNIAKEIKKNETNGLKFDALMKNVFKVKSKGPNISHTAKSQSQDFQNVNKSLFSHKNAFEWDQEDHEIFNAKIPKTRKGPASKIFSDFVNNQENQQRGLNCQMRKQDTKNLLCWTES